VGRRPLPLRILMTSLLTFLDFIPHQVGRRPLPLRILMTSLMTFLDCIPHQVGRHPRRHSRISMRRSSFARLRTIPEPPHVRS
jgi:hypothetical protein